MESNDYARRGMEMAVRPWIIRSAIVSNRWHSGGSAIVWAKDEESAKQVLVAELLLHNAEILEEDPENFFELIDGSPEKWYEAIREVTELREGLNKIFPNAGCC